MPKLNRQKIKPSVRDKRTKKSPKKRSGLGSVPSKVTKPFNKFFKFGSKEYSIPTPNNWLGRLLSKRGRLVPKFFKESWVELKKVTWPNRKETYRLTVAVFIFSIIFGVLVAFLDVGLDKLFREVIINK